MMTVTLAAGCGNGSGSRTDPVDMPPAASPWGVVLDCGAERAVVSFGPDVVRLSAGGETFDLVPAIAASGARYVAADDSTTWLWNKGDATTVTVRGRMLAECAAEPYRAHGTEPFWGLAITADSMVFATPDSEPIAAEAPAVEPVPGGRRHRASAAGQPFVATLIERHCNDGMSDMQYPHTVTVEAGGREWRGCGGDPVLLLAGGAWEVVSIHGTPLAEGVRASLSFGPDGRVSGLAACNRFTAGYLLSGEGLSFSEAAATRRACAPHVMEAERVFLEALSGVHRFEVDERGTLTLHGTEGSSIVARR